MTAKNDGPKNTARLRLQRLGLLREDDGDWEKAPSSSSSTLELPEKLPSRITNRLARTFFQMFSIALRCNIYLNETQHD